MASHQEKVLVILCDGTYASKNPFAPCVFKNGQAQHRLAILVRSWMLKSYQLIKLVR